MYEIASKTAIILATRRDSRGSGGAKSHDTKYWQSTIHTSNKSNKHTSSTNNITMKQVILAAIFIICAMPLRLYCQTDSIIDTDFFQGRVLILNGKEVGRSSGYLKGQKIIRDSYRIDQKTIVFLERDSVTKSVKLIEFSNVDNDTLMSRTIGLEFQNDTLLRTYFYELPQWENSEYYKSYFYYPNGLIKSKSVLLKQNQNVQEHTTYYPTQEVHRIIKNTDSTSMEFEFSKSGVLLHSGGYRLKQNLYDLFTRLNSFKEATISPFTTDKHGEWLYYNEQGNLIKKEIYEQGILKEIVSISNSGKGEIKKSKPGK